jgi:hypothetical protein
LSGAPEIATRPQHESDGASRVPVALRAFGPLRRVQDLPRQDVTLQPVVVLAHFTPTEIPGTLAVLLLGLCIGGLVVAGLKATRMMLIVGASLATFAFLGYNGDVQGWPESLRMSIDAAFLLHAAVLFALTLRLASRQP